MGIDASEGDTADPAAGFEAHRGRLRAIAYRMLGSVADADDAVQDTWLRFAGADTGAVRNPAGWLTTVLSRICLDMLRARATRREESWDAHLPDPVVSTVDRDDPEHQAVLADSVALALLVVLDTLSPPERLAFVLHDLFGVPFAQIGPMLDRSPAAAKQLASRARQRVRANPPVPNVDAGRQRAMADAFLAAARDGDLDRLMAVLDADVVLRADTGDGPWGPSEVVRGAETVAGRVTRFSGLARLARPVVVNGAPGYLTVAQGRPFSLLTVLVRDNRIVEIDVLADTERLERLLDGRTGSPDDGWRGTPPD